MSYLRLPAFFAAALLLVSAARPAEPFAFQDGDRVVWLGNTLIEREQQTGYWETALVSRFPNTSLTFRNLGWSGDTVFGEAWASFDPVPVGFRRLRDHVLALKPTVLVIGYGMNESFAGPAGLPHFVQGLNTLLDTLAPTHARVVLLSPIRHEDMGRPLPDPRAHNKNLRLYTDAIRAVAQTRHCYFVDLFDLMGRRSQRHLTSNGIHFTPTGYWDSAVLLERGLGVLPAPWHVELSATARCSRPQESALLRSPKRRYAFSSPTVRYPCPHGPPTQPTPPVEATSA